MDTVRQAIAVLNRAAHVAGHDTPDGRALREAATGLSRHIAQTQRMAATQHLLGDNEEPIRSTMDLTHTASRARTAAMTSDERQAIVGESGAATNAHKLDLSGTHYEQPLDLEWWLGV